MRDDAYWTNTMLHELGHAACDKYIDPSLPYLLRTAAHTNITEAIALMMGSLADETAWLSSVAGVRREDLADDLEKLAERGRTDRLVFTRWALVMYRFEKALYGDPDRADLDVLWWDPVEGLQTLGRPPGREGAPDWAAKVHLSVAPVYYHNFLLGHLFAAQLRSYLETRVSDGPFFADEITGR